MECGDWKSQRSCSGCSGSSQSTGGWDRGNPHRNRALGTTQEFKRVQNSLLNLEIPFSFPNTLLGEVVDNQNTLGRRQSSLGAGVSRWWGSARERRFSTGVWEHWGHVQGSPQAAAVWGCLLGISVWAADGEELRLLPHPSSPAGPAVLVGTGES